MSLTGAGAGRPAAGRRADRRPAGRHVRRLRRGRRPARARPHRPRPGRAHAAARRDRRRARLPGHARTPSRARCGRAGGNHHPSICPYGLFHCADGAVQIACGSEALWRRLARGLRPRPARAGLGHQRASGSRNRDAVIARGRRGLRRHRRAPSCWRGWPRSASRRARCAPSTRSTTGTRPARRACSSTSSTRRSATIELPGPPLRFDDNAFGGWAQRAPPPPLLRASDGGLARRSAPTPPLADRRRA